MPVRIDGPVFLRRLSHGAAVANVDGATVGDCLHRLAEQFPGAEEQLFDSDGKLLGYIDVYVNGVSAYPEDLAKPVRDGDEISFVYLMMGG
jgi:molybdopterin converting factor small subunit